MNINNQKGFANIILVVVIVVILVGAVGYFAFIKKSKSIAQQSTSTQTNTPVFPTPTSEKLFTLWKGLALKFPARAEINGNSIFIDNSEFQINGGAAGLCKDKDFGSSNCTYEDDKSLTNISVLRLWRNSMGVFALNPLGIPLSDPTSFFVIRKAKPNQIFTTDELTFWKGILNNYVVSSTPPPTSETVNWKTYKNDTYSFEVKYPSNWTSKGSWSENGGFFHVGFGDENAIRTKPPATLRIYPNQSSIDTFKDKVYFQGNWKNTTLGGLSAFEAVGMDQTTKRQFIIVVSIRGSYGYELESTVFDDTVDIVRTMSSTFKFIK